MPVIRPVPLTQLSDHGLALFMLPPLKQFCEIDVNLVTLKARGMAIHDEEKAKRYLNNIGYFRLSAYWHNERKVKLDKDGHELKKDGDVVRDDDFLDGTSFEETLSLYIFDR